MSAVAQPGASYPPRVAAVAATGVLGAFLLQTAVLPAVGLSAAVPVVLTVVAVLGLALGPGVGAVTGFLAGLLLDLTGVGVLGVTALAGCLLGAGASRLRVDRWRWSGVAGVWAMTVTASVAAQLFNAAVSGVRAAAAPGLVWLIGGALVSAVLLVPARARLRAVVR
jgi:rod shape-determining protein MreD